MRCTEKTTPEATRAPKTTRCSCEVQWSRVEWCCEAELPLNWNILQAFRLHLQPPRSSKAQHRLRRAACFFLIALRNIVDLKRRITPPQVEDRWSRRAADRAHKPRVRKVNRVGGRGSEHQDGEHHKTHECTRISAMSVAGKERLREIDEFTPPPFTGRGSLKD